MRKLRTEVNTLREQLLKISEQLDEPEQTPSPPPDQDEPQPEEPTTETSEPSHGEPSPEEPLEPDEKHYDDDWDKPNWRRQTYSYERRAPDWGNKLGDYIGEFVDDIMEGVTSELERTLFVEHKRKPTPTMISDRDVEQIATVMSAMGNPHRIRVLRELSWGGLYSSDLQESLKDIGASTLSSHLNVLEEAGLVVQEKRRGRYLITITGRIAVQMAASVAKRSRLPPEE